jgi:hypothetical protein
MSLGVRVHFAVLCVIVAALTGCGDSKSGTTGASHDHLRADSVGGVLDVGAPPYSAIPGTDAYPALQAAVNDACAQSPWLPSVRIPAGTFPLSQTVLVTCGTEIIGASRHGTVLHPTFNGPAFLLESSALSLATGPALVGTGSSFVEARPPATTINLSDVPTLALDGLSAFTAEASFSVSSYDPNWGYASILTSQGVAGSGGPILAPGMAFGLGIANQTQLLAYITINGTLYSMTGAPTIPSGTTHHGALTFDGAMARLFLDGQVVATLSAPGTITQRPYEDVTIGGAGEAFEGGAFEYPIDGAVDSVRVSNVVRYTSTFAAPTDKFQPDANTLVLENIDGIQPGLVRAWGGTIPYMIPLRGGSFMGGVILQNFTVDGGMGIFGLGQWGSTASAIDCLNCDYGFFFTGPGDVFDDVLVTTGTSRGRYGIVSIGAGGNDFKDVQLDGQRFPLVVLGSQGFNTINRVTVNPGEDTVFGMVVDQTVASLNGVTIGAGGGAYQAGLMIIGPASRTVVMNSNIAGNAGRLRRGGPPAAVSLDAQATRSVIPVFVDIWGSGDPQGVSPILQNTSFVNTQGDPEILDLVQSSTAGSVLSGVTVDSNAPVSNDPNAITLPVMGGLPTTALPTIDPVPAPIAAGTLGPGVFDINAYGAVPNTTASSPNVDSAPGIQAAVDAACARGGGTLVLSTGNYVVNRPILVHCNIEFDGPSMRWSRFLANGGNGPSLVVNPPGMTGIDVAPALVGSGHSMKTDGGSYYVNLSDANAEFNGRGASTDTTQFTGFTAEAFVKMTGTVAGYAGIVQSAGCLGTPGGALPGCTSAFQLGTMDGRLYGSMTLAGTSYGLEGPSVTLDAVHHVAVTYDGVQTLQLWLDGHAVQTQTTSTMNAAISQPPNEDVTVGPETSGFDGPIQSVAIPGYIDSVRISRIAKYTADFTVPTAKLAMDTGAQILLNFDDNSGGCTTSGPYYYPVRRTAEPDGTSEGKVSITLKNFGLASRGLFGVNAGGSKFLNVYAEGDGVVLTGDNAGVVFDGDYFVYGRILAVNASGGVFHNVRATLNTTQFVLNGGDNIQVNSLTLQPGTNAQYAAYFLRAGVTVDGAAIGDGYVTSGVWKGPVVVDRPTAPFRMYMGQLGGSGMAATAAITIDGGLGYLLEGVSFLTSNMDTQLIHLSAPTTPNGLHQAIGLQYTAGSTVSDDPALQLIGSGN